MPRLLLALVCLFPVLAAMAGETRLADPAVLAIIVDDESNPLPRGRTAYERRLPSFPVEFGAVPDGEISTPAEYGRIEGIFMRWGAFNALITEMTVPLTTADPAAIVYMLVETPGQQASAADTLDAAGADMDNVVFMLTDTDSVWIRDYGPRFINDDGERAIVDHTYNRPTRPNDNAVPDFVATSWSEPEFDIPLVHGGGNFHLFADGEAFMTDLILDENPTLDAQDVEDYYLAYQGLDLTITGALPSFFDSTQHIDMWMLPVADREVIVGRYDPDEAGGVPNQVTGDTVADMVSRGYTVHRTDGWGSNGTHYTYTNSVITSGVVLICEFDGYPTENAEALSVYQAAFPGRDIVQVDCSNIIHAAGAIHCIVMHVPRVGELVHRDGFEPAAAATATVH